MLLAIDIGNTDFTIGIFQEKKLCDTFRMRTKINRTSDEYGVFILNTLQYKGYEAKDVEDVIISSVVPAVMHSFNSAIIKYFDYRRPWNPYRNPYCNNKSKRNRGGSNCGCCSRL